MKFLCDFNEAARDYFGGDMEALRQAVIFHGLRPLVEYNGPAERMDDEDIPDRGSTAYSRWFSTRRADGLDKTPNLSGWFYVDADLAARWLADRSDVPSWTDVWVRADSGVPFCGDFRIQYCVSPLWFLISDLRDITATMEALPPEVPGKAMEAGKEVGTRERNSLLRIIAGLCKEAKIDIAEGGKGPAQVEAAVACAGFDGPKEKTVRVVLKQVRELD